MLISIFFNGHSIVIVANIVACHNLQILIYIELVDRRVVFNSPPLYALWRGKQQDILI